MAQYLMKYKGIYRLLPELCEDTHDFPRDENGEMNQNDVGIYISCQHGGKIYYYGLNESKRGVLCAYLPSRTRGRNATKEMDKRGINYFDYDESDEEATFKFLASDIEPVAELLRARTSGASISPFSSRNLPKNKDVVIPDDEMARYKTISGRVGKNDILMFKKWNDDFLENVLQKKVRKDTKDKSFDWKTDAKAMRLGRQTKEYIFAKGFWQEYLEYLDKAVDSFYNK